VQGYYIRICLKFLDNVFDFASTKVNAALIAMPLHVTKILQPDNAVFFNREVSYDAIRNTYVAAPWAIARRDKG
jgi:hypothetical protein